jgi:hypothetical protein
MHTRIRFICSALLLALVLALAFTQRTDAQAPVRLRAPYQVVIGTTAQALTSSGGVLGVTLKAISPGQTIYLGTDNTVSSLTGWPLADGETFTVEVSDASTIWVVASAPSQRLAVFPYRRN